MCIGLAVVSLLASAAFAANSSLEPLVKVLDQASDPAVQRDVLVGIHEALADRRSVPMPAGWESVYRKLDKSSDAQVRYEAMVLSLVFGDAEAIHSMRTLVGDPHADLARRQEGLAALVQAKDPDLVPLLEKLLDDPQIRGEALRALAAYPNRHTAAVILRHFKKLSESDKRDAVMTLSSRAPSAMALLDAVANGDVAKQELTAFNARQMTNLNDAKVDDKLKEVWGPVRGTSKDKLALLAEYKAKFTPDVIAKADLSHGRLVFTRTCGVCHTLFDSGGHVGPNLTGAQRSNLDYVLGKVLDPSAVVSQNYRMTIIRTKDGRVINGIVQQETPTAVTLVAPNETIVVQKEDIDRQKVSDSSLMPEGLLAGMSTEEARDLLAYLASPSQTPLPGGTASAK